MKVVTLQANTDMFMWFLPIVTLRGWRYRGRIRGIWLLRFAWAAEQFTEGMIYRLWCGPLLVIVMADRRDQEPSR